MSYFRDRFVQTVLFLVFVSAPLKNLLAYEEVKIEKIITFPDKKTVPSKVKLDTEGQIWILNSSDRSIIRISDRGTPSFYFSSQKRGVFNSPIDFDFLQDGSMAVLDAGFKKILIIAGSKPAEGEGEIDWKKHRIVYQFLVNDPASIAVSRDNIIAVGYRNQAGVDMFSLDGVHLHRLFPPSKYGLKEITSLAFANNGTLWVLDGPRGILHRFSPDRKWIGVISGLDEAQSVDVDDYGFAYVTIGSGRWKEINPEGSVTGTFGTRGKNPGEMLNPEGLALPDESHILMAERGNKRLQLFRLTNNDKKLKINLEPAAYIQVRTHFVWEDSDLTGEMNSDSNILILNSKKKFEWRDLEGNVKSTWKKSKKTPRLERPEGFTIDSNGQIWVTDQGDHTIKAVSEEGTVKNIIGQKGSKEGSLKNPSFIQVRKDGSFVVADRNNTRVQVLSKEGLFLFAVGSRGAKDGEFLNLSGLAVNDEMIVLLDDKRRAMIFYDAAGKFLYEIANKEGKPPYWSEPVGLASDENGRFYLLDKGSKRVRVFNQKGRFLADFTSTGNAISCGPLHNVLVFSDKSVRIYTAHFVSRAVTNVKAIDEIGDIKISWDTTPDAKQFNVYRSSHSGPFALIMEKVVPPVVDTSLTPGVEYTYAIAGVNEIGYEGAWSLSKSIKAAKRKDISLVSIGNARFHPVFTAAFKYYVDKPIGEIRITNNDEIAHRNVKIAISLLRYTDFPTEAAVGALSAGETRTIPVTLTFNDRVLELTENTPVQVGVKVSYFEDNQEKNVSLNAPVVLYSRNAISWNDKARIASFITPRDTPIIEFARSAIRSFLVPLKGSTVGKPLAKAALFYEAINALGISYVPDPKTPFSKVAENPEILDYVQFPRETLRRQTGDCDDTTSLLVSLLESIGVQTALVDMPGHILMMANLEESDSSLIGLPSERFVEFEGTYWVPIETTRLGNNFLDAWQSGISKIKAAQEKGKVDFIPVGTASLSYPPVTLIEKDENSPKFPEEKVKQTFPAILNKLQKEKYDTQLKNVKEEIKKDPANRMLQIRLGMIHFEGMKVDEAKKIFENLTKEDEPVEVRAAAHNNLGNISYLIANYKGASKSYERAAELVKEDGGILVNQARTAWRLGDTKAAKNYLLKAKGIFKDWREYATDVPAEILP